jgi:tripeptide aminopeptidase
MDSLTQTFFDIVRIDSVTGEEEPLALFIVKYLQKYVSVVTRDSFGNVYARIDGTGSPLFFSAHMDTVEPGRGIQPRILDNYIVTDGSTILGSDNKAALACMLELAKFLHSSVESHRTVEFVFTLSEEVGNYGAVNFDYSLLQAHHGYCFDSGNPVGTIVTASPFYERFSLRLIGKEAHASRPENAINALYLLQYVLSEQPLGKIDAMTVMNFGVLHGGAVRNTIPGELEIEGEIRSFSEDTLANHKKHFAEVLTSMNKQFSADYTLRYVRENPGYMIAEESDFVTSTRAVLQRSRVPVSCMQSWGVSDANIFNDHGLACLNLGHGGEFIHTKKERIAVAALRQMLTVMLALSE